MAINKNEFKLKSRAEARRTKIETYSPRAFRSSNQSENLNPEVRSSISWFGWVCIFGIVYAVFKYLKH